MNELVFFLEEESAKVMLQSIVANLKLDQANIATRYIVFEGKQHLDKNLERRLRGYLNPRARFIVLRDQDSSDCKILKADLAAICKHAGKKAVIRIACHELEAFYLADLKAVEPGLAIPRLALKQAQAKYRKPDNLGNAAQELEKLTGHRYQKIAGSRAIAPHLDLSNTRSISFHHLVTAIQSATRPA